MSGWWLLIWSLACLIAGGIFVHRVLGRGIPLPLIDPGHRGYHVLHEDAARALTIALSSCGLGERYTFDMWPTHQCVLRDGKTVFQWYDQDPRIAGFPGDALSIVVRDPAKAADQMQQVLQGWGYQTTVLEDPIPKVGKKMIVLSTNALPCAVIVFRRHALRLPKPEFRV